MEMQRRTLMKTTAAGIGGLTIGGGALLAASGGGAATDSSLSIADTTVTSDAGELRFVDLGYWKRVQWTGFDEPVTHFDLTIEVEVDGEAVTAYDTSARALDPNGEDPSDGEYVTDFFGGSDYNTGEGTSGWMALGVGDAVYDDGDDLPPGGVSAQDPDTRWIVVEGSAYDAARDNPNGYGLPQEAFSDADGVFNADGDGTSEATDVTYRATFVLYHDQSADEDPTDLVALTGENGGGETAPYAPNPQVEDTFTVTVENEPAGDTSGGDGDSTAGAE